MSKRKSEKLGEPVPAPAIEMLEQRLLYSADLFPVSDPSVDDAELAPYPTETGKASTSSGLIPAAAVAQQSFPAAEPDQVDSQPRTEFLSDEPSNTPLAELSDGPQHKPAQGASDNGADDHDSVDDITHVSNNPVVDVADVPYQTLDLSAPPVDVAATSTLSFWLYVDSISGSEVLVDASSSDTGDSGFTVSRIGAAVNLEVQHDVSSYSILENTEHRLPADSWAHVAVTSQGNDIRLYVNSIEYMVQAEFTDDNFSDGKSLSPSVASEKNQTVQSEPLGDTSSVLHDGRIYQTALTDTQVASLHKSEHTGAVGNVSQNDSALQEKQQTSVQDAITVDRQLLVVDEQIEGYESLLKDIAASSHAAGFDILIIGASDGGFESVSRTLNGDSLYSAVHIVGHGAAGEIRLGADKLTTETLSSHSNDLRHWSAGLVKDADILFYGCNIAQTADGQRLVDQIGHWTEADVAASDDLTGHTDLGGDWEFEYQSGSIESEVGTSPAFQSDYVETFATTSVGIGLNNDGGSDAYLLSQGGLSQSLSAATVDIRFQADQAQNGTETTFISYYQGTSDDFSIRFDTSMGGLELEFGRAGGGSAAYATSIDYWAALLDGEIHTLTVSWDNTNGDWAVYIDGEFIESGTGLSSGVSIETTTGLFVFGQEQDSLNGGFDVDQRFVGTFYDVRIWNEVRSDAEIALNHNATFDSGTAPPGLLANWQMDGFNGLNEVVDIIGGNHLSVQHATGGAFTTSTPVENLFVDEDAANGTVVGKIAAANSAVVEDVLTDGKFLQMSPIGSFETVYVGESIGNWTVTSGSVDLLSHALLVGPNGSQVVDLSGNSPGALAGTSFSTEVGKTYQIRFAVDGNFNGGDLVAKDFRVLAGNVSQDFAVKRFGTDWHNGHWEYRVLEFTATTLSTNLSFESLEADKFGALIADVSIVEMPGAVAAILGNDSTLAYNAATAKFYKYLPSPELFLNAQANAANEMLNGVPARLLTINSDSENQFIANYMASQGALNAFLGASDLGDEGIWKWLSTGEQFSDAAGASVDGHFVSWVGGEPNNTGSENAAEIFGGGLWNDVSENQPKSYIVEWDANEVLTSFTYALTDDANGRFTIDFSNGEITVADGTQLDYESDTSHTLTVRITDVDGSFQDENIDVQVYNINESPVINNLNGNPTFVENGTPVIIDANVSVFDPELAAVNNFDGATTYIGRSGGANSDDVYSETGLLGSITEGGTLVYNSTVVGTVVQNSGGELILSFNSSATSMVVNSVLQSIAYANLSDTPPASVDLHWTFTDNNTGSQGSGGPLWDSGNVTVNITAVNDAPVVVSGTGINLGDVFDNDTDPAGITVAAMLASGTGDPITDADTGALEGVAIVAASGAGNGIWQYSLDGASNWYNFPALTLSNALVLDPAGMIRFVPNLGFSGAVSIAIAAWDQTDGLSSGDLTDASFSNRGDENSLSENLLTLQVNVLNSNLAPVLDGTVNPQFATITEDNVGNAGETIASVLVTLGDPITDANVGADEGIAIIVNNENGGTWQYSTDGGISWVNVGTVSNTSALLLRDSDSLRLNPDGNRGTNANLGFRAWDQTSGSAGSYHDVSTTGGTTAFSTGTLSAQIVVTDVNDAPLLDNTGTINMTTITEDDIANTGNTVLNLILNAASNLITDVDIHPEGFAVIAQDSANGSWEYSTDNAISWNSVGIVSDTSALLLGSTDRLRFVPDGQSAAAPWLDIRAWDLSSGVAGTKADASSTGGTTAFSDNVERVDQTVTAVNDAPIFSALPSNVGQTVDNTVVGASSTSVADIDGDGIADLITTSTSTGEIFYHRGDGTGSFGTRTVVTNTLDEPREIAIADLDLDGDPDLIAADYSTTQDNLVIYSNDGDGNFSSTILDSVAGGVVQVDTGDLDGDGDIDVAATFWFSKEVVWYENQGGGTFARTVIGTADTSVEIADVNSDGALDVIATSRGNDEVVVLQNSGDGSSFTSIGTPVFEAYDVVASDLDGDSDIDLAYVGLIGEAGWLENDGALTPGFTDHAFTNIGNAAQLSSADVDGDGDQDLLVTRSSAGEFLFYENDGAGQFAQSVFATASSPKEVIAADLDNDGDLEVITSDAGFTDVQIYNNFGNGEFARALTNEDVSVVLDPIVIDDIDAASGLLQLTLTINNGSLDLATTSGLNFTVGDGIDDIASVFTGSLTDINAAMTALRFNPATNFYGEASVQVDVNDLGNTGDGGAQVATETVFIDVLSVNDAPTSTDHTIVVAEDGAHNFGSTQFSFSDIEPNGYESVIFTTLPTNGTLTLSGIDILAGQEVTTVDFPNLLYQADPDVNGIGVDSFTFRVRDDGGTANTGVDTATTPNTITVNILAVNDTPVVTENSGVSVSPGSTVTISNSMLNTTDVDNTPLDLTYIITGTPNGGQLEFTGNPGVAISSFTQADIDNGLVVYVHDGVSTANDSFTFNVSDSQVAVVGTFGITLSGATADSYTTDEETELNVPAPGLLGNDGEGGAATIAGNVVAGYDASQNTGGSSQWNSTQGSVNLAGSGVLPTNSPTNPPDGITDAFVLNGTGGFTSNPLHSYPEINAAESATLETWIRFDSLSGTQVIFDTGHQSTGGITLRMEGSRLYLEVADGGSWRKGWWSGVIYSGEWHHIAVTIDMDAAKPNVEVWVDGDKFHSLELSALNNWGDGDFGLGTSHNTSVGGLSGSVSGQIAHFRVHDQVLGSADISYNFANPGGGAAVTPFVASFSDAATLGNVSVLTDGSFIYDPDGKFDHIPAGQTGTDSFTYVYDDGLGNQETVAVAITVTGVNDAPVLISTGVNTLTSINEDDTGSNGDTVADLIASSPGDSITDIDTGALDGIAVYSTDTSNGAWEYSTNGGTSWIDFANPTPVNALLLTDAAQIRFVPAPEFNGTAQFFYRAWDQTAGIEGGTLDLAGNLGGDRSISAGIDTAEITVNAVNDAPLLIAGAMNVVENSSNNIVTPVMLNAIDLDDTASGLTFRLTGNVNDGALIRSDGGGPVTLNVLNTFTMQDVINGFISYSHNGAENALDDFDIDLFDGGEDGTATQTGTVTINISPVNDAPLLTTGGMTISENSLNNLITPAMLNATDVDDSASDLTFRLSGNVSHGGLNRDDGGGPVVLGDLDTFTMQDVINGYISYAHNGAENVLDNFNVELFDGGEDGAGTQSGTVTININNVNDAPVLDNTGTMVLTSINEDDQTSAGTTVNDILNSAGGNRIIDDDPGSLRGVALIAADTSNGVWQYKVSATSAWTDVGSVSTSNALLLSPASLLRFIPVSNYNGPSGDIEFKAWDRTTSSSAGDTVNIIASGGVTAFSNANESAAIDVLSINDAPVIDLDGMAAGLDYTATFTEGDVAVNVTAIDVSVSDIDADEYSSLTIGLSGFADGSGEQLQIGNAVIVNSVPVSTSTTIAGTTYQLAFDGAALTVTNNAGGTLSQSDLQALLQTARYEHTGENPTAGNRSVQFTVNDENGGVSLPAISTISVAGVNDAPFIVNLDGDTVNFTEGDATTLVDIGSDVLITDFDSADFDGGILTVAITSGGDPAEDYLEIVTQGSAPGQIDTIGTDVQYGGISIGTLVNGAVLEVTLNSNADATAVAALVKSIGYGNTDTDNPTTSTRIVQFQLEDGDGAASAVSAVTVNVLAVNDAPESIDGSANALEDSALFSIALSGSDVDGAISGYRIVSLPSNGTLYLDANLTPLSSQVINTSSSPFSLYYAPFANFNGTDSFEFVSIDDLLVEDATPATNSINISPINDVPTIGSLGGDTLEYTEGDGAQYLDQLPNALVTDVDSVDFDTGSLLVSFLSGNDNAEDVLSIANQGTSAGEIGVSGNVVSYGGAPIGLFSGGGAGDDLLITLNANADTVATSALISAIQYENTDTDNPTVSNRVVNFVLNDGDGGSSTSFQVTVDFSPDNDIPTIANLDADVLLYTEGDGERLIDQLSEALVSDVDSFNFDAGKLSVSITVGQNTTEDVLGIEKQGNGIGQIWFSGSTVSYQGVDIGTVGGGSTTNLIVNLNANATAPAVSALLQAITYTNTNTDNPTTATRTVTFTLTDGDGGTSATDTAQINLLPVNDIPLITNLGGDTLNFTEGDVASVLDQLSDATVVDVDSDNFDTGSLTVSFSAGSDSNEDILALVDQGSSLSQIGLTGSGVTYQGIAIGVVSGGTNGNDLQVALNANADAAAVAALLQSVTYQNTDNNNPTIGDRTLSYVLTDGDGGSSAIFYTTVNFTPVNDAPQISIPAAQTINEDTPLVFSTTTGNAISINDVDSGNNDIRTTLTVSNGVFTLADTSGLSSVTGDGTTSVTLEGPNSAIFIALNGSYYTPGLHYNGAAVLTMTADDLGNSGAGGALIDTAVMNITIDPINDDPVNAGTWSADRVVTEDLISTLDLSTIELVDVDSQNSNLTLTLSTSTGGILTAAATAQVAISGSGSGTLELTGSRDNLNAFINDVSSISYLHNTPDIFGNNIDAVTVLVNDNGNSGAGGGLDINLGTVGIDVTPINDNPANTGIVPISGVVDEDIPGPIDLSSLTLADVDAANDDLTLMINSSAGGTLTTGNSGSLTVTGANSGAISLTGTLSNINQWLDSTNGLIYSPVSQINGIAVDSLQIKINDNGNNGAGSGVDVTIGNVSIDVVSVNDEPMGADNTVATAEDIPYTFTLDDFGFTDLIDGNGFEAVIIEQLPANGLLELPNTNLAFNSVVTAADILAGSLKYIPDANGHGTPWDSVSFRVQDDGDTTNGGVDQSSSVNTITIDVISVNDAPEGQNTTINTLEDTDVAIDVSDFGFSDVADNDLFERVSIVRTPETGTLMLAEDAVVAGDIINVSDITDLGLRYQPDANTWGVDQFEFQVIDNGGMPGVDTSIAANVLSIDVAAVNDEPTGLDNVLATDEDLALIIEPDDFGYSDIADVTDNHLFSAVTITSLPDSGSLILNDVEVYIGQIISVDDIENQLLQYIPAQNETGSGYRGFGFQVHDSGGTENGGINIDQTPNQINFDLLGVNDSPLLLSNGATVAEGDRIVIDSDMLFGTDADDLDPSELTLTITSLPSNGMLMIGGVSVSLGDQLSLQSILDEALSYEHDESETSEDQFGVALTDGGEDNSQADTGDFQLTVTEVIDPAAVVDPDYLQLEFAKVFDSANGDLLVSGFSALNKDEFINQQRYELSVGEDVVNGTLDLRGDGTFRYEHDRSSFYQDKFSYEVKNEDDQVTTVWVTISIEPPKGAALAVPPPVTEVENEPEANVTETEEIDDQVDTNRHVALQPSQAFSNQSSGDKKDSTDNTALIVLQTSESESSRAASLSETEWLRVTQHNKVHSAAFESEDLAVVGQATLEIVLEVKVPSAKEIVENPNFLKGLSRLEEDLNKADSNASLRFTLLEETVLAVSLSASAGVLSWTLRAGALFASLMSSGPLWWSIDVATISAASSKKLQGKHEDSGSKEDGKLEKIFD